MTLIPIMIGVLGTLPKRFERELEEQEFGGGFETIQTTTLLRLARIQRRFPEIWED